MTKTPSALDYITIPPEFKPPVVGELRALFFRVNADQLIDALIGSTRRGPKGHPVQVLLHCFLTKYALGIPSTAALIRMLTNNPFIAQACGINTAEAIPHEATFSRFFAKLAKRKYLHLLKDVSRALVRRHYATLPGFGERVALDSTTLKGWVNGGKRKPSDPQARWSVKKNTHGKTEFTLGWKLHLAVDTEYEMPIAANVSPGNTHDAQRASHVLSEARFTYSRFHPKHIIGDKGYSGKPIANLIKRQYRAMPIIQPNKAHKRFVAELRETVETPEWKALYKQRQAVERIFSRLKGQRSLNSITVRGRAKVTAHCYLSLIAMQMQTPS